MELDDLGAVLTRLWLGSARKITIRPLEPNEWIGAPGDAFRRILADLVEGLPESPVSDKRRDDRGTLFRNLRAIRVRLSVQEGEFVLESTLDKKSEPWQAFDQAYVDALIAGKRDVSEHFVAYFTDLLMIKTRMRVPSVPMREDIVQETLMRTIDSLRRRRLRHPDRLGVYVYRICDNTTKEFIRDLGRDQAPAEARSDEAEAAETRLAARKMLEAMPQRDREILRHLFLDGRSHKEVSAELGLSSNYLRVKINRVKAKFRAAIRST